MRDDHARELTARQRQVLVALLLGWWSGSVPTHRELVATLGISCTSQVSQLVRVLQHRGLVEVPEGKSRHLRVTPAGVVVGLRFLSEEELAAMLVDLGERFAPLREEVARRETGERMAPSEAIDALLGLLVARAFGIDCEVRPTASGVLLVIVHDRSKVEAVRRVVPALVEGFPTRVLSSLEATLERRPAPRELAAHLRELADSLDPRTERADAA
jgi:hypothetical protein